MNEFVKCIYESNRPFVTQQLQPIGGFSYFFCIQFVRFVGDFVANCFSFFFCFFFRKAHTTCIISSKAMALPSIVRIIHVQWHIKCCCCFFCIECARLWHIKCAHAMQSIRLYSMCIRFQYLPSINKSQFLLQFNSAVDILSLMLSLFYRQLHTPAWFN